MMRVVSMATLSRAFNTVRGELCEVGLIEMGRYLDRIDCLRALLPAWDNTMGYVFDESVDWLPKLVGYTPGDIYIRFNAAVEPRIPGSTLLDTIRHEFGHSWAWLDRKHIEGRWFREAFDGRYGDVWGEEPEFDPSEYVSAYACTRPAEDFCETFMTYLRCRRSLNRFDRRPGVKRKLNAVVKAVSVAANERLHWARGSRKVYPRRKTGVWC